MPPKIKIERRRQKRRRKWLPGIMKFSTFCLAWMLVWMFFLGSEITISYNKAKAARARRTFWQNTLSVARYIGDFKRALF